MNDKLTALLARCKCGVHLTVNEHRDYYQSPEDALDEYELHGGGAPEIADDVRAGILATGNIVELQFFPDTPIGSYLIVHHSLDAALDMAIECLGLTQVSHAKPEDGAEPA